MEAQAESFTDLGLTRAIDSVAAALDRDPRGRRAAHDHGARLLLRAARPQLDPSREAFAQRLERLESAQGGGEAPAASSPRPAPEPEAPAAKPEASPEPDFLNRSRPRRRRRRSTSSGSSDSGPPSWTRCEQGSELLSHALSVARPIAVDVEQAVVQVGFPVSAGFNKRKAEAVGGP